MKNPWKHQLACDHENHQTDVIKASIHTFEPCGLEVYPDSDRGHDEQCGE